MSQKELKKSISFYITSMFFVFKISKLRENTVDLILHLVQIFVGLQLEYWKYTQMPTLTHIKNIYWRQPHHNYSKTYIEVSLRFKTPFPINAGLSVCMYTGWYCSWRGAPLSIQLHVNNPGGQTFYSCPMCSPRWISPKPYTPQVPAASLHLSLCVSLAFIFSLSSWQYPRNIYYLSSP